MYHKNRNLYFCRDGKKTISFHSKMLHSYGCPKNHIVDEINKLILGHSLMQILSNTLKKFLIIPIIVSRILLLPDERERERGTLGSRSNAAQANACPVTPLPRGSESITIY